MNPTVQDSETSTLPRSGSTSTETTEEPSHKSTTITHQGTFEDSETITTTEPATLAEVFDWKNSHGATFAVRECGEIWVTNSIEVPPPIEAAFHVQRETLKILAGSLPESTTITNTATIQQSTMIIMPDDSTPLGTITGLEEVVSWLGTPSQPTTESTSVAWDDPKRILSDEEWNRELMEM